MSDGQEKRPRAYAAEILREGTREARADALQRVPVNLRALTRKHVENAYGRSQGRRRGGK